MKVHFFILIALLSSSFAIAQEEVKEEKIQKEKKDNFGRETSEQAKLQKDLPNEERKDFGKSVSEQRKQTHSKASAQ